MRFKSQVEKVGSTLMWNYFFQVPLEIAEVLIEGNYRRVICTISETEAFHAALMHDGKGGYYITLNKARRDRLGLRAGQMIEVQLAKDTSTYGIDISGEMIEVLDQDESASLLFHRLTPGKQRTLIHWVDGVKSSEIKIRRALVLMEHLKALKGSLDYKLLNAAIKEANQNAKLK